MYDIFDYVRYEDAVSIYVKNISCFYVWKNEKARCFC